MGVWNFLKKKLKSLSCVASDDKEKNHNDHDDEKPKQEKKSVSEEPNIRTVVTVDEYECRIKTECPEYQINLVLGKTRYTCEKKFVEYYNDVRQAGNCSYIDQNNGYHKVETCNTSSGHCLSQDNSVNCSSIVKIKEDLVDKGYCSQETSDVSHGDKLISKCSTFRNMSGDDFLAFKPEDSRASRSLIPSENAECPELGFPSLLEHEGIPSEQFQTQMDENCYQESGQMQSLRKGSLSEESDNEQDNAVNVTNAEGNAAGDTIWVSQCHVLTRSSSTPTDLDIYSTRGTDEKPTHALFQNLHSSEAERDISRREFSYSSLYCQSLNMLTANAGCTASTDFSCHSDILSLKSCSSLQLYRARTSPKSMSLGSPSVCSVSRNSSFALSEDEGNVRELQFDEITSEIDTSERINDEENGEDTQQRDSESILTESSSLMVCHPLMDENNSPKAVSECCSLTCRYDGNTEVHFNIGVVHEVQEDMTEILPGVNFENLILREEVPVSTKTSLRMNCDETRCIGDGHAKDEGFTGQLSCQNFDMATSDQEDNEKHEVMEQMLNSSEENADRLFENSLKEWFTGKIMHEEFALTEAKKTTSNDITLGRGKWVEIKWREDELSAICTSVFQIMMTNHRCQNFSVLMDPILHHGRIPCSTNPTIKRVLYKEDETIKFAVHSQLWQYFDFRETIWIHFLSRMLSESPTELQFLLLRLCPWLSPKVSSKYTMHLGRKTRMSFSSIFLTKLLADSFNIRTEKPETEYILLPLQYNRHDRCMINIYTKDDDSGDDNEASTREGSLAYLLPRVENSIGDLSNRRRDIIITLGKYPETMETSYMYLSKIDLQEAEKNCRTLQHQPPRLENRRIARLHKVQCKVQSDKWKKGCKKIIKENLRASQHHNSNCCNDTKTQHEANGKKNCIPSFMMKESQHCNANRNENNPGSVNTIMDDFNDVDSSECLNRRVSVSSSPSSICGVIVKVERLGNKKETQNRLKYRHELNTKEMDRIRKHMVRFFQRFEATKHRHSLSPVSMVKIDSMSLPEMLYKIQSIPKGLSFLRRFLKISKELRLVSVDVDVLPFQQSNWTHFPSGTAFDNFFEQVVEGNDDAVEARMRLEWFRVTTFQTYPGNVGVSTVKLANNGFYYTGHTTETRCYFCRQTYNQWSEESDIEAIHRQISPDCPLISGRETNNIPVHGPRNVHGGNLQRPATEQFRSVDEGDPTLAANTMTLPQGQNKQLPQPSEVEASAVPTDGEQSFQQEPASIQTPSKSKIKRDKRKKKKEEQGKVTAAAVDVGQGSSGQGPGGQVTSGQGPGGQVTSGQGPGGLIIHEVQGSQEEPAPLTQSEPVSTSSGSSQEPTSTPGLLVREVQPHSRPLEVNRGGGEQAAPLSTQSKESVQAASVQATANTTRSTQSSANRHGGANPPAPSQGRANPPGPTSAERLAQLDPLGINFDKPKYPSYAVYSTRHSSFEGWPSHMAQTPREMARAGYYYAGYGDYARCFFCGGGLRNWDRNDDPWIEHARWFPRCAFLRNNKGDKYVARVQRRHQEQEAGLEPSCQLPPPIDRDLDTSIAQALREMGYHNPIIQRAMNKWRANLIPGRRHPPPMTAACILDIIEKIQSTDQVQAAQSERPLSIPGMQNMSVSDESPQSSQPLVTSASPTALEENRTDSDTVSGQPRDYGYTQRETQEKKILQEDFLGLTETLVCKVCCDKDVAAAFLPCGHLVCCLDCAPAMRKCPLCDELIKGTVKTYFS